MRRHANNSPQAAGQLLACVMLADGMASAAEMEALERHAPALGLAPGALRAVIQELCEDQLQFNDSSWGVGPDLSRAEALMAAITEPALRRQLLGLAAELAQADRHLSDGEGVLLRQLQRAWAPESALIGA